MLNLKNTTIISLSCCLLDGSFNFLIAFKKNAVYTQTEITSWIYNLVQKKLAAKEYNSHPKTQLQITINSTKYAFLIKVMIQ